MGDAEVRLVASLAHRLRSVRELTGIRTLNPVALREVWRERNGGHPVDEAHGPHLDAAIDWLVRAQDATGTGGIARGYSLVRSDYFRTKGWEPAYPETTGYIIPTLLTAARDLHRPDLRERAERAARWECAIQLPSGAIQGGVVGQEVYPAIFNTGQVIFGWLAAYQRTGSSAFAQAAERAAVYLVSRLDEDGHWRRDHSPFARTDPDEQSPDCPHGPVVYNARTAWAVAEAGARLNNRRLLDAAAKCLRALAKLQHPSSWFPQCCISDPSRPLLHTIAYAIRGLLEGGRVLEDSALIDQAAAAAAAVAAEVADDGRLPGRFAEAWRPAARWSCLTGEAQMTNIWLRLHEITGERFWLEPVPRVLRFIKSTQNRGSDDPGLAGGIKGSDPIGGAYGAYETLSWATKFFADALIRHERVLTGRRPESGDVLSLA
jgi:uncharacterized protein YyaL (SSP411 family)